MKRLSLILIGILTALFPLSATAQTEGYNPSSPPDPELSSYPVLEVVALPTGSGRANVTKQHVEPGSVVYMEAWANSGFEVVAWIGEQGDTLSTDWGFDFRMPETDARVFLHMRYHPSSPADPSLAQGQFKLTLCARPEGSCNFNYSKEQKLDAGFETTLEAYPQSGFRFRCWKDENGTILSTESSLPFVMPASNVTLYADCDYQPDSPDDPNANYWDEKTGYIIMDNFRPGGLFDELCRKVDGSTDRVTELVVAGELVGHDIRILSELRSCALFDMSRTTGINALYDSAFGWDYLSVGHIVLPSTINQIYCRAFSTCSNLTQLTCLSPVPPVLDECAFEGVPEGLTVYVPQEYLPIYYEAEGWRDMNVRPMQESLRSVSLTLPDGSEDGRYKNMVVELVNTKSGQRYRYVVTDRMDYIFTNLPDKTEYTAYLKTPSGVILGQIDGISVGQENVVCTFDQALSIQQITVSVTGAEGVDLTNEVDIRWLDEKGNLLASGAQVGGQVENCVVRCVVSLPQSLAMQYMIPAVVDYTVTADDNQHELSLVEIPKISLSGMVKDKQTGEPIPGVIVTCSQLLNGLYDKTIVARTGNGGTFTCEICDVPTTVTFSSDEYLSRTVNMSDTIVADSVADVQLQPIVGTEVLLSYTYTQSVAPGENPVTTEGYEDYKNVVYTLYNVTQGRAINEVSLQYPKIVLLEGVKKDDVIRVTATSLTDKFVAVSAEGKVDANDRVEVTLPVVQLGGIVVSYTHSENTGIVSMLYNQAGTLITTCGYTEGQTRISDLADGDYTIVTMGESTFFNGIGSLAGFDEAGLKAGEDYLLERVQVKSGVITRVRHAVVPFFDESKLYYTDDNTTFTVNKPSVVAGNYLTFTGKISFKEVYQGKISDVRLVVNLPEGVSFINNSVMLGSALSLYDLMDNKLTVNMDANNLERVRFCAVPSTGGKYAVSASVAFKLDGQEYLQPIGNASFEATSLSITVPEKTGKQTFAASGAAPGKADVEIYEGRILLGKTKALANGLWNVSCQLFEPQDGSEHDIHARIVTRDGVEMQSENKRLLYDTSVIEVEKVRMRNTAHGASSLALVDYVTLFDFQNPSLKQKVYWYWPDYPTFTFIVDLSTDDPTKVDKVYVNVHLSNGFVKQVLAKYNEKMKGWVASCPFDSHNLPVNTSVSIDTTAVTPVIDGPATYVLDPSGFVYEGVESNRLQGVMATIYYKEKGEDAYGDPYENIVVWNAEDYAQQNPLFTDENGMYAWDVPNGEWQVRFEKDGYQTVSTDWLPVPPPQLDVNVGMVPNSQPEVVGVKAFEDGVEIEFSKYMKPETMTKGNLYLKLVTGQSEQLVQDVSIELLNLEQSSENAEEQYVSKVLIKHSKDLGLVDEAYVIVSNQVQSFAGTRMSDTYEQKLDVEKRITSITVEPTILVGYGQQTTVQVAALPEDASKGKTLCVRVASDLIASTEESTLTLDENGQASITIRGDLLGTTSLVCEVKDADVSALSELSVVEPVMLEDVKNVVASRVNGSSLYKGQTVTLSCETEGATIYYTVDGTDPAESASRIRYDGRPIPVNEDMSIKAVSIGLNGKNSDTKLFAYSIRQTTQRLEIVDGWNWISHNQANVLSTDNLMQPFVDRALTQLGELFRDPILGVTGRMEDIASSQAVKIHATEAGSIVMSGNQFNPTAHSLSLTEGWNWLGYPIEQTQSLSEALAYLEPDEGDVICTQDGGFAEYTAGAWSGILETMDPGKGYLYMSGSKKDFVYKDDVVSRAKALYGHQLEVKKSPWEVNVHAHPNMMCMVAALYVDGVQAESGVFEIGAFVGDECRGIGRYVGDRLYLAVYGGTSAVEQVRFVALDTRSGQMYNLEEQLVFSPTVLGSASDAYQLHLGQATGIAGIHADDTETGSIYNMVGQKMSRVQNNGVYVINRKKVLIHR